VKPTKKDIEDSKATIEQMKREHNKALMAVLEEEQLNEENRES
jgi:hypothetical protein